MHKRVGMLETQLYRNRFSKEELARQRAFWKPITKFLQRYVPTDGVTLDLGAGYCHFINSIGSRAKIAVDINEENLRQWAAPEVRIVVCSGSHLPAVASGTVDTVFASNVYEHFLSREDVAASFSEVHRVLRKGGKFVIMQPNFACCPREYFDFFDHQLIFTHAGMAEGMMACGFSMLETISHFLPYTSKSRLPSAPWLVELYLNIRPAWRLLGGQMLLVGVKEDAAA